MKLFAKNSYDWPTVALLIFKHIMVAVLVWFGTHSAMAQSTGNPFLDALNSDPEIQAKTKSTSQEPLRTGNMYEELDAPYLPHNKTTKRIDYYELSKSFAECSALFQAMSEYLYKQGEKDGGDHCKGVAGGAEIASAMISPALDQGFDKARTMSRNMKDAALPRFRMLMNKIDENEYMNEYNVEFAKCHDINPMQSALLDVWRKETYGGYTEQELLEEALQKQ